jgi:hypothetical protein
MQHSLLFCLFFLFLNTFSYSQESGHLCQEGKMHFLQPKNNNRADNTRSDTFDILKYTINLDITDFTNRRISGNCVVNFTPRVDNVQLLTLDLLKLQIDSITGAEGKLNYSYNDTLITINFPDPLTAADTVDVIIYYKGTPQTDASGWGGFYFMNGYAFNLGVGFAADPHNFGRVWFPCFDNFVERSKFEFNILTSQGRRAFCNGELKSEISVGIDSLLTTWVLNEEIPTYLASVAVANYQSVNYIHQGIEGPVPVVLAAIASDTTNFKNSFINLGKAIDAFEARFGPHAWNKVGFSLVPFSSGAMEHATNIAYPRNAANGTLNMETLMAHELAHHWWGDLATCETAEDMWINEGWATYSEHLFTEWVYGENAFINAVSKNLDFVLQYLYEKDNGYHAVSGLPHHLTYSDHVYKKGAAVAHSLRGYLGDDLFFKGINDFFNEVRFTHVNSETFRDVLSEKTGSDLHDFFNNWVFSGGFPHFSIDSLVASPLGNSFELKIYVKQKLKGTNEFYKNVPLVLSFYDQNKNKITAKETVSGEFTELTFTIPFNPQMVVLNEKTEIAQAVSSNQRLISTTGVHQFELGRCRLEVTSVSDTALVRIEHNWVGADDFHYPSPNIKISPQRYWKVDGFFPNGFHAKARFTYDGRTSGTGGAGFLDHELIGNSIDSIIFLYRRNASENWQECPNAIQQHAGSTISKFGFFNVDTLMKGEYCFAYGDKTTLSVRKNDDPVFTLVVYPNPASKLLNISTSNENLATYYLTDILGNKVGEITTSYGKGSLNVSHLSPGIYFLNQKGKSGNVAQKVIIRRT